MVLSWDKTKRVCGESAIGMMQWFCKLDWNKGFQKRNWFYFMTRLGCDKQIHTIYLHKTGSEDVTKGFGTLCVIIIWGKIK